MKKVVIMSDNHGDIDVINKIKEQEKDADYYFHCGDSEASPEIMEGWIVISGNNDWGYPYDEYKIVQIEDTKIMLIHGHQLGYYNREQNMIDLLREYDCNVLLSGHTHVPQFEEIDEYFLVNPGSTTLPRRGSDCSYCVLLIDGKKVECVFKQID